jgi:hypothetical protein
MRDRNLKAIRQGNKSNLGYQLSLVGALFALYVHSPSTEAREFTDPREPFCYWLQEEGVPTARSYVEQLKKKGADPGGYLPEARAIYERYVKRLAECEKVFDMGKQDDKNAKKTCNQVLSEQLLDKTLTPTCVDTLIQLYADTCQAGTRSGEFERLPGQRCSPPHGLSRRFPRCWLQADSSYLDGRLNDRFKKFIERGDYHEFRCINSFINDNFDTNSQCIKDMKNKLRDMAGARNWDKAVDRPSDIFFWELVENKLQRNFRDYLQRTLNHIKDSVPHTLSSFGTNEYAAYSGFPISYCDRMFEYAAASPRPDGKLPQKSPQVRGARRRAEIYGADQFDQFWEGLSDEERGIIINAGHRAIEKFCRAENSRALKSAETNMSIPVSEEERNKFIKYENYNPGIRPPC